MFSTLLRKVFDLEWACMSQYTCLHIWRCRCGWLHLHSLCLCCFWLKRPVVVTVVHLVTQWRLPALYCRRPHRFQALASWANRFWPSKTLFAHQSAVLAAVSFGSSPHVPRHCVTLQNVGASTTQLILKEIKPALWLKGGSHTLGYLLCLIFSEIPWIWWRNSSEFVTSSWSLSKCLLCIGPCVWYSRFFFKKSCSLPQDIHLERELDTQMIVSSNTA